MKSRKINLVVIIFTIAVGCRNDHLYPELDFFYTGNIRYQLNLASGSTIVSTNISKDTAGNEHGYGPPSGSLLVNGNAVDLPSTPFANCTYVSLGLTDVDIDFRASDAEVVFQHAFSLSDTAFTHFPVGFDTLWMTDTNYLSIGPFPLQANEFISIYVDYGSSFGQMDFRFDSVSGNYIGIHPSPVGALTPGIGEAQIWRRRHLPVETTNRSRVSYHYECWSESRTIVVMQ